VTHSEAEFTPATALCPHPERWTADDDESTENEVGELVYGLVRALQPDLCVETGTAFGATAERIGLALATNGHGRLYTLEADVRRVRVARKRVAGLPVTVEWCHSLNDPCCTSALQEALKRGRHIDFAFFDALYRNRVAEFDRFRPFMRVGAIVCFHDTAPGRGRRGNDPSTDIRAEVVEGLSVVASG